MFKEVYLGFAVEIEPLTKLIQVSRDNNITVLEREVFKALGCLLKSNVGHNRRVEAAMLTYLFLEPSEAFGRGVRHVTRCSVEEER